jgi:hypothetical protein
MIQLKRVNEVIGVFENSNRYEKLNLDLVKFIKNSQNISPIMLFRSKNALVFLRELIH